MPDHRSIDLRDVRRQLHQLGMAVHQVTVAGTPIRWPRPGTVLDDARRSLYRILAADDVAEDPPAPATGRTTEAGAPAELGRRGAAREPGVDPA